MTVICRRIRAAPVRTSTATWHAISQLLDGGTGKLQPCLKRATNVAAMLISEEHTHRDPIILTGCGPRVRVYTLHGDAAIDGHSANELPLALTCSSAWTISLPASGTDLKLALEGVTDVDHVSTYDCAKPRNVGGPPTAIAHRPVIVDLTALEEL